MTRGLQIGIKHAADRIVAGILFLVLSPVLGLIALAIKVGDPRAPVLFRQPRLGLDGEVFTIYKFRTMIPDADSYLDERGVPLITTRVTPVGKVLRKLSFDELPQLLNILKGEMSIVGPRPALVEHIRRYTPEQMERLRMRPGVTGLAQINGRNTLKWSQRIDLDREYIRTFSLFLDLRILFKTALIVLSGEGIVLDRNPGDVDDLAPIRDEVGLPAEHVE